MSTIGVKEIFHQIPSVLYVKKHVGLLNVLLDFGVSGVASRLMRSVGNKFQTNATLGA